MAREESEREDLMREATALVERVEILCPNADPIVAGFRADGAFSIFFGEDPAYHFNAADELRRAYCGGLLYKAVNGRLASLRRERTERETQLVRHELTPSEQEAFANAMTEQLRNLSALIATGNVSVIREISADGDASRRVRAWLDRVRKPAFASRPNVVDRFD